MTGAAVADRADHLADRYRQREPGGQPGGAGLRFLARSRPRHISYKVGGYITASIALVMMPWKVLEIDPGLYLHVADRLLGAARADRRHPDRRLLPDPQDRARCRCSCIATTANTPMAMAGTMRRSSLSWSASLPNIPGFLNAAFPAAFPGVGDGFKTIYTYAWFVGIALSALVYGVLMKGKCCRVVSAPVAALGGRSIAIQEKLMTTIVRGGTVVNADRSFRADVLCHDGKIVAVGDNLDAPAARASDRRRRSIRDARRDRPAHPHAIALHGHGHGRRFLHRHRGGSGRRHDHDHRLRHSRTRSSR